MVGPWTRAAEAGILARYDYYSADPGAERTAEAHLSA